MEIMGERLWFGEFADVALMAKTWKSQKHDPFHEFLAPSSEKSGLPLKQKNKKIHSGLLQFAVKLIDTMLHACMV